MSLRSKLLVLALSMLVLPAGGWLLVRQLEALLREGQAQVQLASAQMLARAVASQATALPDAGPAFFVQEAAASPRLDGYDEDWRAQGLVEQPLAPGLRAALAWSADQIYLVIAVEDRSRVRADAGLPPAGRADQIVLQVEDEHGLHRLRLANAAPGALAVSALDSPAAPRLSGVWEEDAGGYRAELRFPSAICRSGWASTRWISPIRRRHRGDWAPMPIFAKGAGRCSAPRRRCRRCWPTSFPKACAPP